MNDNDIRAQLRRGHREIMISELMNDAADIIDVLLEVNMNLKMKIAELNASLEHTKKILETHQAEPI